MRTADEARFTMTVLDNGTAEEYIMRLPKESGNLNLILNALATLYMNDWTQVWFAVHDEDGRFRVGMDPHKRGIRPSQWVDMTRLNKEYGG
jgi:hypothetical protein